MTFENWLETATKKLKSTGIASAHLDAQLLLEDTLNIERSHLLAHQELVVEVKNVTALNNHS